jgi:uncharacterized membrane protein YoaK (UPF0700 family)
MLNGIVHISFVVDLVDLPETDDVLLNAVDGCDEIVHHLCNLFFIFGSPHFHTFVVRQDREQPVSSFLQLRRLLLIILLFIFTLYDFSLEELHILFQILIMSFYALTYLSRRDANTSLVCMITRILARFF